MKIGIPVIELLNFYISVKLEQAAKNSAEGNRTYRLLLSGAGSFGSGCLFSHFF